MKTLDMKIEKNNAKSNKITYIQALAKLNIWDRKLKYYDFYYLHDMELYSSFSKLDVDLESYIKAEVLIDNSMTFKSFANARDGGEFAIWFNKDIDDEPAVVYFDSDFRLSLLATNMESFVCKIANGNTLLPSSNDSWNEIYEWEYEELAEKYENISNEEMKILVTKEIEKFSTSIDKSYVCNKIDEELHTEILRKKLKKIALY